MSSLLMIEIMLLSSVGAPVALLAVLGLSSLIGRRGDERRIGIATHAAMLVSLLGMSTALITYVTQGMSRQVLSYGHWFTSGLESDFAIELIIDGKSLGFATLTAAIAGVVAAFSNRYLHRESGYRRYFTLFAMFVTGMLVVALAGSVEVLFAGWEMVGLSSALLVGYFHERPEPIRSALRVWSVYRMSDAFLLSAAVLLHHWAGSGSLSLIFGAAAPASAPALSSSQATIIAALLVAAVAGKSALLPFSGWLPRAMEGPTPSSAVYYGALSIHAGCFLLLRAGPLLEHSIWARVLAGAAGVLTAIYATLATRVQTDVKSGLAYASLTQVSIIVIEIALGLNTLAFVHLLGHACFRLLQFLTAPNVLHDLHELENAAGHFAPTGAYLQKTVPPRARHWLYLFAVERGFLDPLLDRSVIDPFLRSVRVLDRLDRFVCNMVGGDEPANGVAERIPPDA